MFGEQEYIQVNIQKIYLNKFKFIK